MKFIDQYRLGKSCEPNKKRCLRPELDVISYAYMSPGENFTHFRDERSFDHTMRQAMFDISDLVNFNISHDIFDYQYSAEIEFPSGIVFRKNVESNALEKGFCDTAYFRGVYSKEDSELILSGLTFDCSEFKEVNVSPKLEESISNNIRSKQASGVVADIQSSNSDGFSFNVL